MSLPIGLRLLDEPRRRQDLRLVRQTEKAATEDLMRARIRISKADGTARFLYEQVSSALGEPRARRLIENFGGQPVIRRASHVEPTPEGQWTANMAPSGGTVLGTFNLRQDALCAEVEWLEARRLRTA